VTTTILLVEDEVNDVLLITKTLNKAGVNSLIQVARDGQEALDYLTGEGQFANREKYPLPCLVLLDLKLPRVMGLEVLRRLDQRRNFRRLVVIVLTSSQQPEDIDTAYDLGAKGYLVKPSGIDQFEPMARAIKDFWLTQNRPPASSPALEKPSP
jgi:CheY-like chemotaxis protein